MAKSRQDGKVVYYSLANEDILPLFVFFKVIRKSIYEILVWGYRQENADLQR